MERAKDAEDCNQHTLIHAQEEAALRRRYHYALQVTSMTRHPLLTRFLDWLSHHIFHAEEDAPQRDLLVWFGYYIAQPPAIACLLIGLLGLLTVYSQIAVINYSRSHFQPIMKTALEDLSDTILSLVDGPIHDASKSFAVETNTILSNLETDLNTNVFGVIVRAAGELNSGLAIVQTTLVQGVETVFGQGPFGKLILSVLQCLLFNKFHAVESGLIWLQDHAQIKFPRLSENVLVLEQNKLNDLIATATAAAVNDVAESPLRRSTPGNMNFLQQNVQMAKSAVDKVLSGYENDLREDLPVYYGLIGVWGMVLAMGLVGARVLWTRQ
ncbi:plasma membrane fusion protein prm1 [Mortierella sp. GBA30]|nr:plasma membrane fusion protein prm1 [Mortierella sp. GBA30]